jgi:hypothetical protein
MEPTLVETLQKLRSEGYTEDFNLHIDCLSCQGGAFKLHPEDFHIDGIYRFEGATDPGDSTILYAISSSKYHMKGVLVNAYGVYAEPLTNEMLEKLS